MVVQEGEQVPGRVGQRGLRRTGPDRRHERQREVRAEIGGEPACLQELAQRQLGLTAGTRPAAPAAGQHPAGAAMEPQHLRQHGRVAAAAVAQARGQAGQAAVPGVAEPAARARHRHAHLRALDGHAKLAEEPGEQRVRAPVVHDEAGVEEDIRAVGAGQLVSVRVPAEPVRAVEEHDIVAASEDVAGREAGDAAAHDGDFAPGHSAPWVLACGWVCAWFELRPGSGLVAGRAEAAFCVYLAP